ncbi:glycosyltransferase family 2 protein [Silicimonas algicola]|uniref:Glycosyltransferase involved in cell wall biosynthesis n=1 Tax=Silicimonas algicola TaxID=1826607 RepID=A0A316FYE7_9RHOB|nr:glycosyltransferase family 2 protein [Silicimonas algicola]AZQ66742.1 glycosyltransferase family 2 protein [Silicimonas algicola]PWK53145.1 glycosyltransferase involved in cell wall biosynthesis [Silicimonas algicola]
MPDNAVPRIPCTVVIPARNEAAALPEVLSRLSRFAEVVVLDSQSEDATAEVAEAHGARVLQFAWDGRYPKKRNWFLLTHPPATPWVLFLDADEFVDAAFVEALARAIRRDDVVGYWLTYSNSFLGRPLRHGVPQRKLALFRVGAGLYERIEEEAWSGLDMEIHEHPILEGRTAEITVPIEHRDDRGLAQFLRKHIDYAAWEAKRTAALAGDPLAWEALTGRQRFKYRHIGAGWYAMFYFVYTYVVKLGVLDGRAGYHYATYKAWYFRTIRLLLREQSRTK